MMLLNSLLAWRVALFKVARAWFTFSGSWFACVRTWFALVALCWFSGLALAQPLQPIPQLKTRVTDLTGTLDAAALQGITAKLAQIEQAKGSQVAVLIVASTQPEAIEQYAQRVTDQWKLGRGKVDGKSVDDGVLLLIAKDDRKIRIAVGKGLEGAIPDIYAKRIARDTISPKFKLGDFGAGIVAGVDEIGKLIAGETLPEPWHAPDVANGGSPDAGSGPSNGGGSIADLLPVLIFLLIGAFILTAVLGKVLGSTASGLGGGFIAATLAGSPIIGGVVGIGLFLLMLMFGASSRRGVQQIGRHTYGSGPAIFPGGFGGGGSWGGGGSSGGGGFSGGGGDFGGGGASSDW